MPIVDIDLMMTIDEQLQFFKYRFGRTMRMLDLERFRRELISSNLDVMSGALRQAEAAATAANRAPTDARGAVLAMYDRGVAHISQLFPVFFVFESAWRSFVASMLRDVYGEDGWWHEVRDAVAQGASPAGISTLAGRPVAAELVRTIGHALKNVALCDRLSTTYEFVEACNVQHLGKLIEFHWRETAVRLNADTAMGVLTKDAFASRFNRVRHARNAAYHHRAVTRRAEVVSAAEQLLDLLDVHLGERSCRLANAKVPALSFVVAPKTRHI